MEDLIQWICIFFLSLVCFKNRKDIFKLDLDASKAFESVKETIERLITRK